MAVALMIMGVGLDVSPASAAGEARGYELVSPADKSAGMVTFPTGVPGFQAAPPSVSFASATGDAASFVSYSPFADPTGGLISSYRARRSAEGWKSIMWSPKPVALHPDLNNIGRVIANTSDYTVGYIDTDEPFDPADGVEETAAGFNVLGRKDVYARNDDGTTTWISRPNGSTLSASPNSSLFAGATHDGKQVFFESTDAAMPGAAAQSAGSFSLYRRVNGETQAIATDGSGDPISTCGSVLAAHNVQALPPNYAGGPEAGAVSATKNAINADASRIYFTAPDPNGRNVSGDAACQDPAQLYLRAGDDVVQVSATQRTVPETTKPAYFQGVSADGSRVFFTSDEALVDAATPGTASMLYEYDAVSQRLRLITPGGDVNGVAAVSDDGAVVYYVQGRDFVVAADGQSQVVGPDIVDPADTTTPIVGAGRVVRLSADGHEALFLSRSDLTSFQSGGIAQAYLFSLDASTITCISCNASGSRPIGDAALRYDIAAIGLLADPLSRNLSADGKTAYFNTRDALAGADDNAAEDVYEWHDGVVTLISDGRNLTGSYFFDSAADGRDVFFSTTASLVSQDYDNGDLDIYDARVGGGFGSPSPPVSCAEDQCQGAPRSAPALDVVSTTDFDAAPEEPAAVRPSVSVGTLSSSARSAWAKRGRATLKLKVTSAGTAKVVVTGRVAGKSVIVARASRKASKAGALSLTLSLSSAARQELAHKHTLKLTIKTTFTGAASRSATLTLSTPATKKR